MGKTYLAVKGGQQWQPRFDRVLWRSLRHSPPLARLLEDIVGFLTGHPAPHADLAQLTAALQAERCLIILDNLESVMQPDQRAGTWQPGYEGYGELLQVCGTTGHQSCLLLTSRENPSELSAMAGHPAVQTLTVQGSPALAQAILQSRGLTGNDSQLQHLCQHYGHVPLALALIATLIQELFGGDVGQFLAQETWLLSDLRDLLASQVDRLPVQERAIAYWLAINQETTTLAELAQDLIPPLPRPQLLECLESLRRRSLVESQLGGFTLPAVVMEYLCARMVEEAYGVLTALSPDPRNCCLRTLALLKAQAPTPVQAAQRDHLVQPLLQRLLSQSRPAALSQRLQDLLRLPSTAQTYWAGNLMNLLVHLQADLRGQSFADLTLWQGDFRGVPLSQTNFRYTDLSRCRFSVTFGPVYALTFSRDGQTLVTGHGDGELRRWDLAGDLHQQLPHPAPLSTLAYRSTDSTLAVGSFDGTVHLYTANGTLTPQRSHPRHTDWVFALAFVGMGDRLASGSGDGTLQIWDPATDTIHHQFTLGPLTGLSVSQDGWLVGSDELGTLLLWAVDTPTAPWRTQLPTALVNVAISTDGTLVASVDTQQLQIWRRQGPELLPLWQTPVTSPWTLAFSPQGHTLAVTDGAHIHLFDAATSRPLHTLSGHGGQVWALAFDPTGTLLASGSDDQISLWQVSTGQLWRTWQSAAAVDSPVLAATFSQDGRFLASGDGRGEVRLWDCQTYQCLGIPSSHQGPVRSLALLPPHATDSGCPWVASGDDSGTVRLWQGSPQTDSVILNHPATITALAFSPDRQWLASGDAGGTLHLWHLPQKQIQASLSGHEGRVLAIAFSPAHPWLATSSSDYAIRLWQLDQPTPQITLRGHQGWVWAIAFSPDGRWLASGADDHTVKVWDLQQQTCIHTFDHHAKLVWSVAFWPQPDSTLRLVSASLDQTVQVWSLAEDTFRETWRGQTDLLWALQPVGDRLLIAGTQGKTLQLWHWPQPTPFARLTPAPLYAGMDITGAQGLAPATLSSLQRLGAIAQDSA
jgi:WD40 repeat protein